MPNYPSKSVLIIGSGGREHALGWKLSQSPEVDKLYFVPGNAGTAEIGTNVNIGITDVSDIVNFVEQHNIDLTVVANEKSLEAGLTDALAKAQCIVFGPSKKAAELETSKAFATEFMIKHGIPHPESHIFSHPDEAVSFIKDYPSPIVIKANGLAGGKGVFLPDTVEEAEKVIREISSGKVNGAVGEKILIQKRLIGREASIIAFTDGKTIIPLLPAQDYKRAYADDRGPNTGGMGSFAPSYISPDLLVQIHTTILQPTIDGMATDGIPYQGVLYAGLMLTDEGPQVIEYNARFGDPETQPSMMMLESDLFPILMSCAGGGLSDGLVKFKEGAAVCVVLAEKGYPGKYETGHEIFGLKKLSKAHNVYVFHANTVMHGSKFTTAGGRSLGVTAYGSDLEIARQEAYKVIGEEGIWFEGMEYRKDIAL